jgi:hypothetical protein
VTSPRVWYLGRSEEESVFTTPDWARSPLDEGTRTVIEGGMRVLHPFSRAKSEFAIMGWVEDAPRGGVDRSAIPTVCRCVLQGGKKGVKT